MRGWVLGLLTATVLAASVPAYGDNFSSVRVLTLCQTPRSDPASIIDRFRADGWMPDETSQTLADVDLWTLAFTVIGTQARTNPEDWKNDWPGMQSQTSDFLKAAQPNRFFLRDPTAGTRLMVSLKIQGQGVTCILLVPTAVAKKDFPNLPAPVPPAAIVQKTDSFMPVTSVSKILSLTVAIDSASIEQAVGVKSDLGAIFETVMTYPSWAVSQ